MLKTCVLLLIVPLLASVAHEQDKSRKIGEIEFFGYAGVDLDKVRSALPVREGDQFTMSDDSILQTIKRIREDITRVLGQPPTDVAPVCCDAQGNLMIYIGLLGASNKEARYNPLPEGNASLPPGIVNLYREAMEADRVSVLQGKAIEDDSRGYALSTDANVRPTQLKIRAYALSHQRLLSQVLHSSKDPEQRTVAAHFLGYARRSRAQIADLVWAGRDADEGVRNDAIRALAVLAQSSAKIAGEIPAEGFVEMLSSGSWTDRNKSGFLLRVLSGSRNPKLLGLLRSQALETLIEMARWRSAGHAESARILLGRVADIEENRLQKMIQAGDIEQIINALQKQ